MAAPITALLQCVQQESALIRAFIAALESEANALAKGELDEGLNATTAEKNRCAEELTRVGEQRDQLLQQAGFATGKEGIDAAAETNPALAQAWKQLLDDVAQASQLNQENGALIERLLKQNNETLQTLRQLAGGSSLYDASGKARQGNASRTSIRAG